jgi:hypothetical protein
MRSINATQPPLYLKMDIEGYEYQAPPRPLPVDGRELVAHWNAEKQTMG